MDFFGSWSYFQVSAIYIVFADVSHKSVYVFKHYALGGIMTSWHGLLLLIQHSALASIGTGLRDLIKYTSSFECMFRVVSKTA